MRLDCYLFERGIAQSRQKAKELIQQGVVWVGDRQIFKSSYEILGEVSVRIENPRVQWVARSGEKLYGFLSSNLICVEGREVLDIGSSTGGFSEVLLYCGARKITCVDVGSNQLHPKLRNDHRICFFENQDIRTFFHPPFDLVVCDVSFISLYLVIHKIYTLTLNECILLFKPQFEVGKDAKRNKRGVITDSKKIKEVLGEFLQCVQGVGFELKRCQKSLLKGKSGNEEYFIYLRKS